MRKSADAFAFQTMLLLCVIWGIQQVTIKWAATDIAPVMQAAIRSGIAAALVGLLMCWRGGWEGLRQGTLGAGLLTGTLFALEFLFIALGLQYTTASHMSVFLYTAPIFSALGLHFLLPSERLRPLQWLGVAVCFGGIAVAFGGGLSWAEMDGRMLLGDAFGLLAGDVLGRDHGGSARHPAVRGTAKPDAVLPIVRGMRRVIADRSFQRPVRRGPLDPGEHRQRAVPGRGGVVRQLLLLVLATASLPGEQPGDLLLHDPLFGVTFGVLLLGEPLSLNFVAGAALVLAGITLVSGEQWLRRLLRR